jgi:hypothetical protein
MKIKLDKKPRSTISKRKSRITHNKNKLMEARGAAAGGCPPKDVVGGAEG